MSRPEKFLTASDSELWKWYWGVNGPATYYEAWHTLRDEVAREVREECAGDMRELRDSARMAVARAEAAERERDGFKAWVERAESALAAERAKTADAKREGAWEALTKLHNAIATSQMPGQGAERNMATSFDVEWFRDTHYAPPAPAGVTLGEYEVRYHPNWQAPWVAYKDGEPEFISATKAEILLAMKHDATLDEYAALLRLADREGKGNG